MFKRFKRITKKDEKESKKNNKNTKDIPVPSADTNPEDLKQSRFINDVENPLGKKFNFKDFFWEHPI